MTSFAPYVTFDGTCRDAMAFYADALGGEITMMMTFAEMPGDFPFPDHMKDHIAHANLKIGDRELMASDQGSTDPFPGYGGFTLQLSFDAIDTSHAAFAKLAKGGKITMPIEATFWAAAFGMCTDKFGVPWMINCDLPPEIPS